MWRFLFADGCNPILSIDGSSVCFGSLKSPPYPWEGFSNSLHFVRLLLTSQVNYVAPPWINCKDIFSNLLVCLFPLVLWCSKYQTLSEWRSYGSGIDETFGRHFSSNNSCNCRKPCLQNGLEIILQHHTFFQNYWGKMRKCKQHPEMCCVGNLRFGRFGEARTHRIKKERISHELVTLGRGLYDPILRKIFHP